MDRRLSAALAWGVLALIIVGPGAELLTRKSPSSTDPISASAIVPVADTEGAAVAAVVPPDSRSETAGPPLPPTKAPDATPPVAADDTQPTPDPAAEVAPVPAVGAPATETAALPDDAVPPVDPPNFAETAEIAPPAEATPVAIADLPVTHVDKPDATEIAARVRDLILSDTAEAAPDQTWTSAIGTLPEPLPETIPYPAPAEQRPRQRIVTVAAQPIEPIPDIRPDNAIFFHDWQLVPPQPIGGPRY